MMKYEVTEHKRANYTVRIHRPILTDKERETRIKEVKAALVQYGRERMKQDVCSR